MLNVVVLGSGRGSNLRALLDRIDAGQCAARIAAVVADKPSAGALDIARARNIETRVVVPKDFASRADWDRALAASVVQFEPGLVVLAGFMRIVGETFLSAFPGRVINVHPSLLPAFPGVDGPAQAIRAGVKLSGCTVHVVDLGTDTGPILAQAAVPLLPGDDVARLHERIQRVEHMLLPAVVHCVGSGQLALSAAGPEWAIAFTDSHDYLASPRL